MAGRLAGACIGVSLALGLSAPAPQAATRVAPWLFQEVSSGVALIKTANCSGRVIGQGTGFLVGESVVMTARHVLKGACSIRVTVGGEQFFGGRWVYWRSGVGSGVAEDLATLKLGRASTGYVFSIRRSGPPAGTNLGMVGYPLGNRLSLNQGKIIWRGKRGGAPLLAVKMLGAEGASGAPFIDDAGRVVGILQLGLGSKDVLGQRTAGVLVGLDLVRWWGQRARLDLCRSYPKGGIADCPSSEPPPQDDPTPPPTPPPPAPPAAAYKVKSCWIQYTAGQQANVDESKKLFQVSGTEMLTNGHDNYWAVIALEAAAPSVITGVTLTLSPPNGSSSWPTSTWDWKAGNSWYYTGMGYTWSGGGYFWQRPAVTTGTSLTGWKFEWRFPDGQSCTWAFGVL